MLRLSVSARTFCALFHVQKYRFHFSENKRNDCKRNGLVIAWCVVLVAELSVPMDTPATLFILFNCPCIDST